MCLGSSGCSTGPLRSASGRRASHGWGTSERSRSSSGSLLSDRSEASFLGESTFHGHQYFGRAKPAWCVAREPHPPRVVRRRLLDVHLSSGSAASPIRSPWWSRPSAYSTPQAAHTDRRRPRRRKTGDPVTGARRSLSWQDDCRDYCGAVFLWHVLHIHGPDRCCAQVTE